MLGFENFSVMSWVEDGLTKQLPSPKVVPSKRRSGSWKIVAAVVLAASASTTALAMDASVAQTVPLERSVHAAVLQGAGLMSPMDAPAAKSIMTRDSTLALRAGIPPAMSEAVRALALRVIAEQEDGADEDIEAWAKSLAESMYS